MYIADLNTGSDGSVWYDDIPKGCYIDGYTDFTPIQNTSEFITITQEDSSLLFNNKKLLNKYDLVIAEDTFAEIDKPDELARSINSITKPDGCIYLSIPESSNISDKLYRLIHPDGGYHFQQFTKETIVKLFSNYGFVLLNSREIPNDWSWILNKYSIGVNEEYISTEELKYIANSLSKELTLKKGYFYGWELIFRKKAR